MIDPKEYAGVYYSDANHFATWGCQLVFIIRPDKKLYYLISQDRRKFYIANHGTHSAEGNTITGIVECWGSSDGKKTKQLKWYPGEKVVIKDEDFGDTTFILTPEVEMAEGEPPAAPDGELQPGWVEIRGDSPQDGNSPPQPEGGSPTGNPPSQPEGNPPPGQPPRQQGGNPPPGQPPRQQGGNPPPGNPPPKPPNLPPHQRRGWIVIKVGPPPWYSPPLSPEEEEKRRAARKKEKEEQRQREQEELERTHPLRKLLFENAGSVKIAGSGTASKPEKFLYVIGQRSYFYVQGSTVNIYGFVALTDKAEGRALPLFFHAGADETVPWVEMIKSCAEYGDIDDFFISSGGDTVKNVLAEVRPKAKWLSMIWSVPSDAPHKKEAERLTSDFDNDFKKFWRFRNGIESFEQAEATAKEYIVALEKLLKEKYPGVVPEK